jgi:WD40 repeat protein
VATGDCEQLMKGHTDRVLSAAFSPDGQKVVSSGGYGDQTVRVWDVSTGNCEQTMKGHTADVWSAAFSPEGRQIVSASGDSTVRVWEVATD